tara:strand:+ start:304 stop:975 length:672 start_codon:yes stop_codon:yes gene_type:complete
MAITINGNGTVTGISAGGLPDGCIQIADLAATGASGTTFLRGDGTFQAVSAGGASNVSFNSGNGIDFSATADSGGTSASEVFDDYEEGTWQPTLSRANGFNLTSGYVTRNGTYTKVGRVVHATCQIYRSTGGFGGGSSYYWLTGLPFTADTSTSGSLTDACSMILSRLYIFSGDRAGGVSAMTFKMQSGGHLLLKSIKDNSWHTSGEGNTIVINGLISYFTAT